MSPRSEGLKVQQSGPRPSLAPSSPVFILSSLQRYVSIPRLIPKAMPTMVLCVVARDLNTTNLTSWQKAGGNFCMAKAPTMKVRFQSGCNNESCYDL